MSDDIFEWRKRALEDAMTPTGFELLSADEFFTRVFHGSPKPWMDAQLGDVWALTLEGEEVVCTVMPSSDDFRPVGHMVTWGMIPRRSERIESGRRIWPEEAA